MIFGRSRLALSLRTRHWCRRLWPVLLRHPAIEDPLFAGSGIDGGWLTTVPETRAALFYDTAGSDPDVIAHDEQTKDVISRTDFIGVNSLPAPTSRGLTVPVLLVMGSNDAIYCGPLVGGGSFDCSNGNAIAGQESAFYSPQAHLWACSIPDAGHEIGLHFDQALQAADITLWSWENIGQQVPRTHAVLRLPSRRLPVGCSTP